MEVIFYEDFLVTVFAKASRASIWAASNGFDVNLVIRRLPLGVVWDRSPSDRYVPSA